MTDDTPFHGDPADTEEQILRAVYEVLRTHGYAGASLSRIASESGLSKATIYHYYDDKDELLYAFVEYLFEYYVSQILYELDLDARGKLRYAIDFVLGRPFDGVEGGPSPEEVPNPLTNPDFVGAMIQLRAQAAHDERFRAYLTETDQFVVDHLTEILDEGVASGSFRPVDTEHVANTLVTILQGATLRSATTNSDPRAAIGEEIDEYLEFRLYR
jgi:AcrR family transcriptional regulator